MIDQESAFKAKLGLCEDIATSTLTMATTSTPTKMPIATDTITRYRLYIHVYTILNFTRTCTHMHTRTRTHAHSVYSIIMDQTSGETAASLDLGDGETQLQTTTDNEVMMMPLTTPPRQDRRGNRLCRWS